MSRRGLLLCGAAAVLFGAATPASSRLAEHLPAFVLAGLLYLGAALAVTPFAGRRPPTAAALRAAAPRLAPAVVLGGAVAPVLLALGLRRTPSATVALLLNLELVFTAVVARAVFREHLGRRVVAGVGAVAAAGVVLTWGDGGALRWGALAVAGACLCWSIDNAVTANLDTVAPAHLTLLKGVVAGGANLALGLAGGGSVPAGAVLGALVVGALGYGASITLWVTGARELGAARGQLVFALAPFVGAAASWVVLRDPVQARQVAALAVALAGVALVSGSGHEHLHHHDAREHDHAHTHDDAHHDHAHDDLPAGAEPGPGRHAHRHVHAPGEHAHGHVPDVHHHHDHDPA